jgi:hypothetical protein
MRNEYLGYGAAVLLFGGVVLWVDEAPAAVVITFFGLSVALIAVMLASLPTRPKVLLVGERPGDPAVELIEAFGKAGYGLCRCYGPSNRPCPVLLGMACPAWSDRPAAAIIMQGEGEGKPLPPCGSALMVPSMVVQEEPARAVVRALDRMLGR